MQENENRRKTQKKKLKDLAASATVPPIFAGSIFAGPHVLRILRIGNRGAQGHGNKKQSAKYPYLMRGILYQPIT